MHTACHKVSSPTVSPAALPPHKRQPRIQTLHRDTPDFCILVDSNCTLTSPALDASLGARHGEDGETVVILGTSGLDGANVAVAASAEHSWKIQRLDSLRLHLPEHGPTHGFELTV